MTASLIARVTLMGFLLAPALAWAQTQQPGGRSYITPFPPNDRYQALVIGDGLAQGLASGLTEAFKQDGSLKIADQTSYSFTVHRPGNFDWNAEIDRIMQANPAQIVVIMAGTNDGRTIRTNEGAMRVGTPGWREAYGRTVEKILKKFKALNISVYWVGLPVMSSPNTNEAMEAINEVLREKTYLNGLRFIDTWSGFADQFGNYSSSGPDLTGQTRRLREGDGVYFTAAGNRKLAHYVEVVLRRDLTAARAERNVPLAGDESEQRRLVPRESDMADAPGGSDLANNVKTANAGRSDQETTAPETYAARPATVETVQIGAAQSSFGGEMIAGDTGSGVTALASISPATDLGQRGQGRAQSGERLYNKVLVKGEYLPPKPGRADNYAWPQEGPAAQGRDGDGKP